MTESHVTARGAGHEAFMHLFADPFDAQAVAGFNLDATDAAELKWQQDADAAEHARSFRHKLALGAVGLSVVSAVVGAEFLISGRQLYNRDRTGTSAGNGNDNPTIVRNNIVGGTLLGVAGAAAVSGALLWFWPSAPSVSVASTPGCEACLAYQRSF
jgi:hypothetical protein